MTILTGVALGESLSVARKSRSRQYNLFLQEGGNLLLINTVAAAPQKWDVHISEVSTW